MRKSLILALAVMFILVFAAVSFSQFNISPKKGEVVDLSVLDASNRPCWWPYVLIPYNVFDYNKYDGWRGPYWTRTHIIDSHTGTHYDAPMHFIPPPGFKNSQYTNSFLRDLAKEYEAKYGPIARSTECSDKVPIEQFCGPLKVVDVGQLEGTAGPGKSPVITMKEIKAFEAQYGPIKAGDVVSFQGTVGMKNIVSQHGYAVFLVRCKGGAMTSGKKFIVGIDLAGSASPLVQ